MIGKQKIWRVKSWEEVDPLIFKKKEATFVRIKDILNEIWEDE